MRYFKTTNASRPYTAGGREFTFEAVSHFAGAWSGLLAIEDDASAEALVAAKYPQITEVTAEEYEAEKKRLLSPLFSKGSQPQPKQPLQSPEAAQPAAAASPVSQSSETPSEQAKASADLDALGVDVSEDGPPDEIPEEAPAVGGGKKGKKGK